MINQTKNELELKDPKEMHETVEEDEDWEDDDVDPKGSMKKMIEFQLKLNSFWAKHNNEIKFVFFILLIILYFVYLGFALSYKFGDEGSIRLLVCTLLVILAGVVSFVKNHFGPKINLKTKSIKNFTKKYGNFLNKLILFLIILFFLVVLLVDFATGKAPLYNLVSLAGFVVYILIMFIFSYNPARVRWRTVCWGFALQVAFALFILRLHYGFLAFEWLGNRVSEYLSHVEEGSKFIFGKKYEDHFFAMRILPTVIFISSSITILFYLGAMQWIILKLSWVMQATMATTAGESVNAAGNIFIGQTETPLIIRPILPKMTPSEVHAVMTGGFATIAGGVLAAFILFKVPANHLISASVMSAPAALAISKLAYPETKKSQTSTKDVKDLIEKCPEKNIIEAASAGASAAISLVANIAANILAFIALLSFINATLIWLGDRIGSSQPITFQFLCSYFMWPFALVMGVELNDCRKVARLVGVKTFINEFVAFEELGLLIANKNIFENHIANNGSFFWDGDDVILNNRNLTRLINGVIGDRSIVISTYALCGFSNFSSIGVQIGALSAMVPKRRNLFSRLALRAMISGSVACFITACVAGVFYQKEKM